MEHWSVLVNKSWSNNGKQKTDEAKNCPTSGDVGQFLASFQVVNMFRWCIEQ